MACINFSRGYVMPMPHEGKPQLPNVKSIIAIGSGKGGVGKSTVAWYLAHALSHMGLRVGVLDADVYGPSLPHFLGSHEEPQIIDRKIIPLQINGISCMSMGFLIPPEQAAVWRGPMLMTAIKQMLWDVEWGVHNPIDYLIVDLPPGTGDVPLTLTQQVQVNGALIVTTSHPLAVDDAMRAKTMFERLQVPLVGVVENMSTLACASCRHTNQLFSPNHHPLTQHIVAHLPFLPPYAEEKEWYQHVSPIAQKVISFS